jgi:anti-anti-sigma regulatory factor
MKMLRITVKDDSQPVTFQLEGKLAGDWVRELEECWRDCPIASEKPAARIDLTQVTFVDAAGKEFLAARYREGHELVASGCMMKAVVSEITGTPMVVRQLPATNK